MTTSFRAVSAANIAHLLRPLHLLLLLHTVAGPPARRAVHWPGLLLASSRAEPSVLAASPAAQRAQAPLMPAAHPSAPVEGQTPQEGLALHSFGYYTGCQERQSTFVSLQQLMTDKGWAIKGKDMCRI